MELYVSSEQNDGRKPYGTVAAMVNDLKDVYPWISRHTINFAYNKFLELKDTALDLEKLGDVQVPPSQGGWPSGTTKDTKIELKSRIRQCLNACASEFHEEKNIVKRDGKYLKTGCLYEIIKKQKAKFSLLASVKIDKEAICLRYYWGSLTVTTVGPLSPIAAVEHQLPEWVKFIGV